eukprot:TRINITY_DN18721_c0_g1_i1.p1 TRINITY_DN18721_c0_g1~~TRINITY_DN18721_c0_g1_i1.p1  ORF type:complete len:821 (+),score=232.22 TRINITY_DN18721_c0_g1_i1:79-2541(+)
MSLFKARERWTAAASHLGQDEEFDTGCMCVGNLDNDPSGDMKIATGSFQGVLRIFKPQEGEYGVEDLLYEQQYDDPILQLEAGQFSSNNPNTVMLAVLHSRKLVIYSTTCTPNPAAGQPPVQVSRLYDHPLDRPSSNFCVGAFGSAHNKDYVCVQSMDGLLSFFEQEVRTFSILRSDFLLPGPIAYNPKTDSLITASAAREVQAYQYTEMAAAASAGAGNVDSSLTQFKKLQVSWSFSVGEAVVDIQLGRVSQNLSPGQHDIIVLGVHTLLFLKDSGGVRAQKRMDYNPIAMHLYDLPAAAVSAGSGQQGLIISTASNSILIYHGLTLMWAAKTPSIPVCLSVGSFGGLDGLIATLSDQGDTNLLYLGTDPPTTSVVGTAQRELNYEKMDEEQRRLLEQIRDATSEQRLEPKDVVHLRPTNVQLLPSVSGGGSCVQLALAVSQAGVADIRDVCVSVSVPHGLVCSQELMAIPRVAGTPMLMQLAFESVPHTTPPALEAQATASYKNSKGEPRVSRCKLCLPLGLVARLVPESKEPSIMFTLHTEQPPVHLPTLYADMCLSGEDPSGIVANMVGFQYSNGEDVKLIASKNAGRYRVQADSLACMAHLVLDFASRLEQHHGVGFKFSFQEELPTKEYFNLIEEHHTARLALAATRQVLSERAAQFRAIEKRLLIRFKERNPAPMDNLDKLLESTYHELVDLGEQHEQQQPQLQELASRLSCGTRLFVLLLKFKFGLDQENVETLECHFHSRCVDNFEQGWEERVNASLLYLLRTTMAKQGKASESALSTHNPGLLEDVSKLKKHIQLVVDRLGKGLRPVAPK